jgi:3-hydroxybutyryl-CoA dehydrogenase
MVWTSSLRLELTGESIPDPERLGVAGSGAIACGLAAVAAERGPVVLAARSRASAERVAVRLPESVRVEVGPGALAGCTYVVEAIAEDAGAKAALLRELDAVTGPACVLATTTSSLGVASLAEASGRPDRFAAFHVFNPVKRMQLVELAFPPAAGPVTRARTFALCAALGKTAVEVPDTPGFVVNRLLFPFLFDAVRLLERTGLEPEAVDRCTTLGLGHPMGPLALLDLVGLDVAVAIGETIDVPVPDRVHELVAAGSLGRKAGRGFYAYPG